MSKAPDAFRTISEVADWLETPAHVLRFWESKFTQVKPVKRAGGRRYYRPSDMLLLGGIKRLLHQDGKTIKEVQNLLRDQGAKHVSGLSILQISDQDAPVVESTAAAPEPEATEETVVQGVFRTVAAPKETETPISENDDQMMFPGFEFSSDRSKAEPKTASEPAAQPTPAPFVQEAATFDPASEPAPVTPPQEPPPQAPASINISHIPDDPSAPSGTVTSGLLARLCALPSGSLASKPAGLKQAVEKLAAIAESRASSGNS